MHPKRARLKILCVVGARPQFIKALALVNAVKRHNRAKDARSLEMHTVHTGQHYDHDMSQVFFDQLKIPAPEYNLGIKGGSHGQMTARMLGAIERILLKERPDWVVVFGDTNSTLAGALAAAKLQVPVAHVEAGLRSFNRRMPEEVNRLLTDHISTLLFCPSETAVSQLKKEGVRDGVFNVGDVMYDTFKALRATALKKSRVLARLALKPKGFCLATVHRQENTDNHDNLRNVFRAFARIADKNIPLVVPLHPRTQMALRGLRGIDLKNEYLRLIPPQSYFDTLCLEIQARAILTDSGGVQREAYFARVPCVTLREETEWTETLKQGGNRLAGTSPDRIIDAYHHLLTNTPEEWPGFYGNGGASRKIVEAMISASPTSD